MAESRVFLDEVRVLRVKADWKAGGPPAAFERLEDKLPSLKGRKFYGTFQMMPVGEEYYACVARTDSDDPEKMQLETGVISGGWYARRKLSDWEKDTSMIGKTFDEMARNNEVDEERPSIEYYRSRTEVFLFLPIRDALRP